MAAGKSDLIDLEVVFKHGTANAVLIEYDRGETWLARSLIEIDGEETRGETVTVTLPEWLAIEKELV